MSISTPWFLLGSVSTQFPGRTAAFGAGAASASFVFFALGYGARLLRPVFARPFTWKVLDVLIGLTMARWPSSYCSAGDRSPHQESVDH
jgi:Lysine efflux permease